MRDCLSEWEEDRERMMIKYSWNQFRSLCCSNHFWAFRARECGKNYSFGVREEKWIMKKRRCCWRQQKNMFKRIIYIFLIVIFVAFFSLPPTAALWPSDIDELASYLLPLLTSSSSKRNNVKKKQKSNNNNNDDDDCISEPGNLHHRKNILRSKPV